ncbi:MAG: hypothetical protein B6D55_04080 [Candidatus Omnitrophica bacterium 4484_70.2]|nr:MAG: hypothetical protein B6D55_04080 [Candidatus Omnitrophica bacterium 4484_70.2]
MSYLLYIILRKSRFMGVVIFYVVGGGIVLSQKINNVNWEREGEFLLRMYQDTVEDNSYESRNAYDTYFRWKNKILLKSWDGLLKFNLEAHSQGFGGDGSKEDVCFLLKEAFLKLELGNFGFTLGKDVVNWGKLDDVVILDRISPQDYKWFILFDKQERKEPTFMFKINYHPQDYQIEAVYLPLFKPSTVRFFGSNWALFGHIKKVIEEGNYPRSYKEVVRNIRIEDEEEVLHNSFENGEVGVRLQARWRDFDYTVCYMYLHNRIPVLRELTLKGNTLKEFLYFPTIENLSELVNLSPTNSDLTLKKGHSRLHIGGLSWETVIGEYGVRGELALFKSMPYLGKDFSYLRKDTISFGIGVDHMTPNNFYGNLQFIEELILNYEELFSQEEYSHQITLTLKKDFLGGDLVVNLDSSLRLSYGDWMVNPSLAYKFNAGPKITLGGFIFEGGLSTLFGRFSNNDLVYIEINYKF